MAEIELSDTVELAEIEGRLDVLEAVAFGGSVAHFASVAAALAGTTSGQSAIVPQAGGYAYDFYDNVSGALVFRGSTPTGPGATLSQRMALEGLPQVSTQPPRLPVVWLNPAHGKLNDGRIVQPQGSEQVSHNAFASTSAATNGGGGGTFTANYTTDEDGKTVHRWQMTTGAHVLHISPNLAAGLVKVRRLFIKSAPGAGNQDVTAGLYNHNMTHYAITEGGWTEVSLSVTATANDSIGITSYTGLLPVDMLIKDAIQVYFDGEAPPATEPSRRYAMVKRTGFTAAGNIPFGPGNTVAPFDGVVDLRDQFGAAPSYSELSFVVALREDGVSDTNGSVLNTDSSPGYHMVQAGSASGGLAIGVGGLEFTTSSIMGKGWIIVAGRMSATQTSTHLNGVSTLEGSGHAAITIPRLYVGGNGPSPAGPFNGLSVPPRFYDRYLSDDALAQAMNEMRDALTHYGDVVPRRNWYFAEGDSNDVQPGSEGIIWGSQIATNLGMQPFFRLRAVAGSTLSTVMTRMPLTLQLIKQAVAFGDNAIFSLHIGTNNNPLPAIADLRVPWAQARAAGARVIAVTVQPRGDMPWGLSALNAFNAAIRADSANYDGLIDIAADPTLGDPTVWGSAGVGTENTTYVYSDRLHWKNAARLIAVGIGQPIVAGLMI